MLELEPARVQSARDGNKSCRMAARTGSFMNDWAASPLSLQERRLEIAPGELVGTGTAQSPSQRGGVDESHGGLPTVVGSQGTLDADWMLVDCCSCPWLLLDAPLAPPLLLTSLLISWTPPLTVEWNTDFRLGVAVGAG